MVKETIVVAAEEKGKGAEDNAEEDDEEQAPEFSLITGKYRQAKQYGDRFSYKDQNGQNESQNALVKRNQEGTVAKILDSAAGKSASLLPVSTTPLKL